MKLTGSFATSEFLPDGFLGKVSLSPEGADFSRVDEDRVRLLIGHDVSKSIGQITSAKYDNKSGEYICDVYVPNIPATEEYRDMVRDGVRGLTSVGAKLTDVTMTKLGETWRDDEWKANWVLIEISDVGAPADNTRLKVVQE